MKTLLAKELCSISGGMRDRSIQTSSYTDTGVQTDPTPPAPVQQPALANHQQNCSDQNSVSTCLKISCLLGGLGFIFGCIYCLENILDTSLFTGIGLGYH